MTLSPRLSDPQIKEYVRQASVMLKDLYDGEGKVIPGRLELLNAHNHLVHVLAEWEAREEEAQ